MIFYQLWIVFEKKIWKFTKDQSLKASRITYFLWKYKKDIFPCKKIKQNNFYQTVKKFILMILKKYISVNRLYDADVVKINYIWCEYKKCMASSCIRRIFLKFINSISPTFSNFKALIGIWRTNNPVISLSILIENSSSSMMIGLDISCKKFKLFL